MGIYLYDAIRIMPFLACATLVAAVASSPKSASRYSTLQQLQWRAVVRGWPVEVRTAVTHGAQSFHLQLSRALSLAGACCFVQSPKLKSEGFGLPIPSA